MIIRRTKQAKTKNENGHLLQRQRVMQVGNEAKKDEIKQMHLQQQKNNSTIMMEVMRKVAQKNSTVMVRTVVHS